MTEARYCLLSCRDTRDISMTDNIFIDFSCLQVIKDFKSIHSKITLEDLKEYKADEVKPLEASLPGVKGYKILTSPPPAGGAALINILNILNGELMSTKKTMLFQNNTFNNVWE